MTQELYASTLKGVCRLAYDGWHLANDARTASKHEVDRDMYGGQMQAYSRILRVATGRNVSDPTCLLVIDQME